MASPDINKDPPPTGLRQWPSWLGIGLATLLARLPWPLQRGLGRLVGRFLHAVLRDRRRVAARNIALCFPELDAAQQAQLVYRSFSELGIGLFEFARAWWGSVEPMRHGLRVEGLEHLAAAREGGRGVIVISGHFTTLEM
ncbi:MAG: lipid A biosynthesis lauroyl acyltransferase, partial [Pseudoxanthomonas sp.]